VPRRRPTDQTASPQRNFTLTTAERLQAIVTGPPAWARRRKRIEDLSAQIVELHREGEAAAAKKKLVELVALVDAHNTYYPMEANLPFDPITSRMMELGVPWRPMPRPTIESLVADAARAERADAEPASLAWSDDDERHAVSFDAADEAGETRRYTLEIDEVALTCRAGRRQIARIPTPSIGAFSANGALEITTGDAETIRLPFRLDETSLASLATELGARLRVLRATAGDPYR